MSLLAGVCLLVGLCLAAYPAVAGSAERLWHVLALLRTGVILLAGLFVYDIFWVFCTPVMVAVAKSFDAPIKLLFKRAGDTGPLPFR